MDGLVEVRLHVGADIAAALGDPKLRYEAEQAVRDVVRRSRAGAEFKSAFAEIKAEARASRLTDQEIDAELDAYNAERRGRPPPV